VMVAALAALAIIAIAPNAIAPAAATYRLNMEVPLGVKTRIRAFSNFLYGRSAKLP
jgi:hypothetical protein